ncbi:SLC39A1 [Branchiostoma lanceolatum]|uniref:Zinc transporter ZIP3 n=1 Tax=Branchiostoma lanceolatum TaxID=7740 RepID=A0A8K0A2Z3_BRALA|nr:SLC39A1 [Branchiostoma lanceolatum]
MDLIYVQVLTLFGLLFSCLASSLIPLALARRASKVTTLSNTLKSRFLSNVNSFVGGVLLATCFLHLLPEVREDLEILHGYGIEILHHYPMAEAVTCLGFLIVHLIDGLTPHCSPQEQSSAQDERQDRYRRRECHSNEAYARDENRIEIEEMRGESRKTDNRTIKPSEVEQTLEPTDCSEVSHEDSSSMSKVHTILLLVALSVHGALEGVAIGLQPTQSDLLWLFFVVVVHKCIIALSLGLNVAAGPLSWPYKVVTCVVFSVSGPIGQGIGLVVTKTDAGGLVTGILQGVATGTLVHVTFMEVLASDMKSKTSNLLNVLSVVIGFALIAGLTFLPHGDH